MRDYIKIAVIVVILFLLISSFAFLFYDIDEDGLSTIDEVFIYRSSFSSKDTDGDGLHDGEEVKKYDTNPNHAEPQLLIDVLKIVEETDPDLVSKLLDQVYDNDYLKGDDKDLLQDMKNIGKGDLLDKMLDGTFKTNEGGYSKEISDKERDLFSTISKLTEDYPDTPEKLEGSYPNFEEVSVWIDNPDDFDKGEEGEYIIDKLDHDIRELTFLIEENKGLKEAFLDEDGRFGENEKQFMRLFFDDYDMISEKRQKNGLPLLEKKYNRGIGYQILQQRFHIDGKITDEELNYSLDIDDDGLIRAEEEKRGLNFDDPDFDNDGLKDGWEVFGFQRKRDGKWLKYMKAHQFGLSPKHKDIIWTLNSMPFHDVTISDKKLQHIADAYDQAPVSNPDGKGGINFHFRKISESEDMFGSNYVDMPLYGVSYYCSLRSVNNAAGRGMANGWVSMIDYEIIRDYPRAYEIIFHELGHNILGKLDAKNQAEDDVYHSRYELYQMSKGSYDAKYLTYHSDVWDEIERDGILGLPWNPTNRTQEDLNGISWDEGSWKIVY